MDNTYLKGQPWDEQAISIYKFHNEKQAIHGATSGKRGRPDRFSKHWAIRDTAAALDLSVGYISESINLAKYLSLNSELKYVEDRYTALDIMNGKQTLISFGDDYKFLIYVVKLLEKHNEDKDVIFRLKKMAKEIK